MGFLLSSFVRVVKLGELSVSVDLDDIFEGTLADCDLVLVKIILKRNLIPVSLFSSGRVIYLCEMARKLVSVLSGPVRDTAHMMTVLAADTQI